MNEISRKNFFKEVFGFFKDEVEKGKSGVPANLRLFILPPGVNSIQAYLQSCDQCFNCVSACPPMALEVCRDRQSDLYGYPVIEPGRQVCEFCEDYPCIAVCPTPALELENKNKLLARAVIIESQCLAYQNHFCISCLTACPPQFKAIELNGDGLPVINEGLCVGCGLCAHVCPAPKKAIAFKIE